MDDPLSALDMHVADLIMSEGICGYLKHKTRVIVTNAIQHLKYADIIYVVDKGRIERFDSMQTLELHPVYNELKKATEDKIVEEKNDPEDGVKKVHTIKTEEDPINLKNGVQVSEDVPEESKKIIETTLETNKEEDREYGAISWTTFLKCLKIAGGIPGILVMTILTGTANFGDYVA